MLKRDKYEDLRIGVKSLYSGHKASSIQVIFNFLAAYSINLDNELRINYDFTIRKKVVSKNIEKSQK